MQHKVSKHATTDLTQGRHFATIAKFALPFMLSDFLQQLYNAVDSIIIGQNLGSVALAGIGVATPIMSIVMNFLMGLAMGTGVILSQYFGRGDMTTLKRVLSTGMIAGGIFTVVMSGICVGLSEHFLIWLGTPAEAIPPANSYLKIIFAGGVFTFLYNYYMFSMRAVGNSVAPLVFLGAGVVLNAALDIILVVHTPLGIEGAAVATIAAQALSVFMCVIYVRKRVEILHIRRKEWVFDRRLFATCMTYGLTVGLQQVVVYAGRLAVQGLVNTYGTDVMAGVNNATRLDALMQTPWRGYTNALTNYYAQNWGAGKRMRINLGFKDSIWLAAVNAVIFLLAGVFLSVPLSRAFVGEGEGALVVEVSARFLEITTYGYAFVGIILLSQAFFKGVGMMKCFFMTTVSSIAGRVAFSYLFDRFWGLEGMYWAVPASWVLAGCVGIIFIIYTYARRISKMPASPFKPQSCYNAALIITKADKVDVTVSGEYY